MTINKAQVEENDDSTEILLNKLKDHVGNNTTITLTNVNSSDQKTHPVTTDIDAILMNKLKNHVLNDTIVTPCNLDNNVPNTRTRINEINESPMNEENDDVTSDDPARIEDFAESTTLMLTNLKDHVRNVTIGTNEIPAKNLETEKFEDY